MRTAFANMALNTGSNSTGEPEITFSTSEVAASCSSASSRSRVSRATFVSLPAAGAWRAAFGVPRRFNALRCCVFAALPPVWPLPLIAYPEAQERHRINPW